MPTINDATVVSSAYDTSGNGGRKLGRLGTGEFITGIRNTNGQGVIRIYKSSDGNTWSTIGNLNNTNYSDVSLVTKGTTIYALVAHATEVYFYKLDGTTNFGSLPVGNAQTVDTSQTAMGNVSLAINEAGTELHATWASKNTAYPNSFNIRYAKGTISAVDGSVTWGSVVQVTTVNTLNIDDSNPTIVLNSSGNPVIIYQYVSGTSAYQMLSKRWDGTSWASAIFVYNGTTYAQSNPSAIFVPQSVNGLANGRIWVAWDGLDATDTAAQNIRISYSDDGGVTWSAMTKLTVGNASASLQPSITANRIGEVFIAFSFNSNKVSTLKYNGTWGGRVDVKTKTNYDGTNPNTLYDLTFGFTSPLFIYKDDAKVGFYGTWSTTTISVTQGPIGAKSDKSNLLTYVITTNETMSTITEKVNGTVVNTKTATSGQSLIAGLTQAQWDAIIYGKYAKLLNLIPDFTSWTLDSGVTRTAPYQVTIAPPSTAFIGASYVLNVKPGTTYNLSLDATSSNGGGNISVYDGSTTGTTLISIGGNMNGHKNLMFTPTQNTVLIQLQSSNVAGITIVFSNVNVSRSLPDNNTLTVEMGADVFTYTFDKRLATTDDIASAIKAVQDSQTTYLPSVKAKLGGAIRGKGGTVNDTDAWDTMVSALNSLPNPKIAKGSVTATVNTLNTVNNLSFTPDYVILKGGMGTTDAFALIDSKGYLVTLGNTLFTTTSATLNNAVGNFAIVANGFQFYGYRGTNYNFIAIKE